MFNYRLKADSVHCDQFDTPNNISSRSAVKICKSNEVVWFGRCDEEDVSGICSPPLWKTSNPNQKPTTYNQLPADAKAQAVARGQQELMEMINNMSESSYELSLKDIVEHDNHQRTETQKLCRRLEENKPNGGNNNPSSQYPKEMFRKWKTDGIMKRSGSLNNGGFLLKMAFPFDLRLKGKKRVASNEAKLASSMASPRSSSVRSWDGSSWFGDKDSKGITSTSRGDSKQFATYQSSTGTNSKNNRQQQPSGVFLTGCWSVFSFKKNLYDI